MILNLIKIIFLFFAIWFGFLNIGKIIVKDYVQWDNILIMAIGITGFLVLQFNLI